MAAKKAVRSTRAVRTKAEVSSEFESIAQQARAAERYDAKTAASIRAHEDGVRSRVSGITVESAVEGVTKANLSISRTLSDVQQKLSETVQELQTVSEAVDLKRQELEQLHKIDIAQTALDTVISEHEAKTAAFDQEVLAKRQAWTAEQAAYNKAHAETVADMQKFRTRDQAEYEYNLKIARQKEKDQWEAQVVTNRKGELELQEKFDKALQIREDAMVAREAEYTALRTQIDAFPAVLKKEVDTAVAIATNSLKKHYDNEISLLKKDAESDKKVSVFQIQTLEKDLVSKNAEISGLRASLEAANARVTEIASKAFDATSGQVALDRISQMTAQGTNGNGNRPKA